MAVRYAERTPENSVKTNKIENILSKLPVRTVPQ
jgi:hypothetical protein